MFALLFLAADIRDDIIQHFRPVGEGLAGSGDRLIGAGDDLGRLELFQSGQHRHIALDGAVRLNGDKSGLRAETFALMFDNFQMLGIDFRHDHRNVRRPAVRGVIGDDRNTGLGIGFF
ncbi:hypothetical protein D3C71_1744570 [compost metagenome]